VLIFVLCAVKTPHCKHDAYAEEYKFPCIQKSDDRDKRGGLTALGKILPELSEMCLRPSDEKKYFLSPYSPTRFPPPPRNLRLSVTSPIAFNSIGTYWPEYFPTKPMCLLRLLAV